MPTINQLASKKSRKGKKKKPDPILGLAPFRKGVCSKVYMTSPKKPSSANRTCAKIILSSGKSPFKKQKKIVGKKKKTEVIAYIPYQDGRKDAKVHSIIYIEKRNKVDLPGVRYVARRGWGDLPGVANCKKSRSRKGTSKPQNN